MGGRFVRSWRSTVPGVSYHLFPGRLLRVPRGSRELRSQLPGNGDRHMGTPRTSCRWWVTHGDVGVASVLAFHCVRRQGRGKKLDCSVYALEREGKGK